jgi:hypothetical protein
VAGGKIEAGSQMTGSDETEEEEEEEEEGEGEEADMTIAAGKGQVCVCVCVCVCDVYAIDVHRDREGEREISESKIFACHSLFLFVQEVDMETGEGTLLTIAARLPTAMLLLLPLLPMPPTVASRFVRALLSGLFFFFFCLLQGCVSVSFLLVDRGCDT